MCAVDSSILSRILGEPEPALHPLSLRRTTSPEGSQQPRPKPKMVAKKPTLSQSKGKIQEEVISVHDTDSEMDGSVVDEPGMSSLVDIEAEESGDDGSEVKEDADLSMAIEETEEDRLFIDESV
jgi:hypothetical protein